MTNLEDDMCELQSDESYLNDIGCETHEFETAYKCMELQIPKPPTIEHTVCMHVPAVIKHCPNCGEHLTVSMWEVGYCSCGQKLLKEVTK